MAALPGMDVWCAICGHLWDALDPAVRFVYGDGRWECQDETQCFGRLSIRRALDSASEPLHAVPEVVEWQDRRGDRWLSEVKP